MVHNGFVEFIKSLIFVVVGTPVLYGLLMWFLHGKDNHRERH